MSIPVACSLSGPERRERQQTVIAELCSHIRRVAERADGYALDLDPGDEAIAAAITYIELERRCCPFLRFTLTIDANEPLVELALTGGLGTRDFLAPWLAPRVAATSSG